MVSFIDKLKKGMGAEEDSDQSQEITENPTEEVEMPELIVEKPRKRRKLKKMEIKAASIDEEETPKEEEKEKITIQEENTDNEPVANEEDEDLFEAEGQLAVDIYQTEKDLIIQSAVAGVNSKGIDIALEKDVLTIKGCRRKPESEKGDYFSQECFWGPFSREIILPAEVDPDKVLAKMQDGILTIKIPKLLREKRRKIMVS